MRGVFGRVWFGVWLGCFTAAAAQLPPEILMDKYLRQAEQLVAGEGLPGSTGRHGEARRLTSGARP